MEQWNDGTLGDVSSNIQTGPFGSQLHQSDYSVSGTPVVMPKDLEDGHISEASIARVSSEHIERLSRHKIKAGDILYSRRGDVGRCAYATEKEKGWLCGTGCLCVTIDTTKANPKFIFYQLKKPDTVGWIEKHAIGSTMLNLNTSILSSVPIRLPSLQTQNRIADILSAYDNLIENNQKQIKLLEEAAQRLYREWFVNLRFPGWESVPVVDGVPEGWKSCCLDDIDCRLESGSRPKGGIDGNIKDGIPSIGAENVIGLGKYNFSSEKLISRDFFDTMKKGKIRDRDILIYKDGAYIGRTSLFQDGFPHPIAAVNEHVFLLHSSDEILQYFLFFTLCQKEYFLKIQNLNKNSAQPGINSKSIMSLDILLPEKRILSAFNDVITPMLKVLFVRAKQNRVLSETRDRLLQKLINGEIEVI